MDEKPKRTFWQCGWRPAIGWICTGGLAWIFLVEPVLDVILKANGIHIQMPQAQTTEILSLTASLLGMSAIRTYDKRAGLTK